MQTISVRGADQLASPAEADRKTAVRELIEDLDNMSASASHIPDEEMDALISEAIKHVRHLHSTSTRGPACR